MLNELKDLFFGNDTESEEKGMGNTENMNEAVASEGNIISADMLVGDIITKHPLAAQFLMECGMGCIYCPASQMESLAEACAVHGIDGEEITDALNDYLAEHNN
jgi:hydroxylamine reductase